MSKNQIDYEKGLTFEKVWANIEKFGEKYDAIFEREAQARQKAAEERQKAEEERQKAYAEERRKAEEDYRKAEEDHRKAIEERRKAEEYHRKVVEESRKADEEHPKKIDELFEDNFYSFEENFNRFGEVPEYLVALKIFNCFNEIGYNFVVLVRGGVEILENDQVIARIDILLENKKTIAVVMVNPEPTLKDIKKYLKLMSIARKHYDKLGRSDKDLIGVVAGDIFPDNVKKFTIETGFYVIVPDGETLKIEVPENFKPKIFKH